MNYYASCTHTLSHRVITFPWQPQDYFVKSLALWKIARQYQYHAMLMPLEPLQVLLQTLERTWKGTEEKRGHFIFYIFKKLSRKKRRMKCNSKIWEREEGKRESQQNLRKTKKEKNRYISLIFKFLRKMFCLDFSFLLQRFCSQNVALSCHIGAECKMA